MTHAPAIVFASRRTSWLPRWWPGNTQTAYFEKQGATWGESYEMARRLLDGGCWNVRVVREKQ